ncbi:MAG: molybdate ABC transporter substrate-binding protein [Congregibacter sp.]
MVSGAHASPLIYNGAMLRLLVVSLVSLIGVFPYLGLGGCGEDVVSSTPLRVAVASNFGAAATQIADEFERQSGVRVDISTASTGVLAAQFQAGAPFDVLLAADKARPSALEKAGLTHGPAVCYAQGALVLLGAETFDELRSVPNVRIAIANPRSAPYGAAALAALRHLTDRDLNGQLSLGTNVLQALQFFQSGAVDYALVARALSPREGLPIPQDWHAPIEQYAVVNAHTANLDRAQAFVDHLRSAGVQAKLANLGYDACS